MRCYDFPSRTSSRLFASLPGSTLPSSVRVSQQSLFVSRSSLRSRKAKGCFPGRCHCSTGDPIAGLLPHGRERDLPGFQAIHPVPLPRSSTPAEPTIPRLFDGFVDAAPTLPTVRASAVDEFRGSVARLRHLLPTLQESCCHHPCKARFRLAGSPLPGGS